MTPSTTDAPRVSDDEIIDSISTTYDFGWRDSDEAGANARRGLDESVVREISALKGEPEWMLAKRLKAYEIFMRKPMPTWGIDLSTLDLDAVKYFVRSTDRPAASWDDLPEDIKNTYDRIGIPEAERERRANIINADGEKAAAETLAQAAEILAKTQGAINLRTLNTLERISTEPSQKTMMLFPIELIDAIRGNKK